MRLTRKFLAFVLTFVMISSLTICGQAMTFSDVSEDHPRYEAIMELSGFGIINGYTDGTFQPEKAVTRAEMAKLIAVLFTIDEATSGTAPFSDVPQDYWGLNYIIAVKNMGIIEGFPDGTFMPDQEVTYEQAITMIIRAFRYEEAAKQEAEKRNISPAVDWSYGYRYMADQLGISKNARMTISDPAPRGIIAQLLYNGLDVAPANTNNSNGDISYEQGNSSLRDQFSYKSMKNVQIVSNPTITLRENESVIKEGYLRIKDSNGLIYDMSASGNTDWESYIGQYVNISYEEYKGEYIIKSLTPVSQTTEISLDKIKSVTSGDIEYYTDDRYNSTFNLRFTDVDVIYNERPLKVANKNDYVSLLNDAITLNNGALSYFGNVKVSIYGNHALINVKAYKSYLAKTAIGSDKTLYLDGGASVNMDTSVKDVVLKTSLKDKGTLKTSAVSIAIPRLINIAEAPTGKIIGSDYVEYIVSDATTGTPSEATSSIKGPYKEQLTINGNKVLVTNDAAATLLEVNKSAKYYMDANGNIAYVDATSITDGDKRFAFFLKGETKNDVVTATFLNPETDSEFTATVEVDDTYYDDLVDMSKFPGKLLWVSLQNNKIIDLKYAENVDSSLDGSLKDSTSVKYTFGGTVKNSNNSQFNFTEVGSGEVSTMARSTVKSYLTPKSGSTLEYNTQTISLGATHVNKYSYEIQKNGGKTITVIVADAYKGLHSRYNTYVVKGTSGYGITRGEVDYTTLSCYNFKTGADAVVKIVSTVLAEIGLSEGDVFICTEDCDITEVDVDKASGVYILLNADYASQTNDLSGLPSLTNDNYNAGDANYRNGFESYKISNVDKSHTYYNYSLSLPLYYRDKKIFTTRSKVTGSYDSISTYLPGDNALRDALELVGTENWNGDSVIDAIDSSKKTESTISDARLFVYDTSADDTVTKIEGVENVDAYLSALANIANSNIANGVDTILQDCPLVFTYYENSTKLKTIYVIK